MKLTTAELTADLKKCLLKIVLEYARLGRKHRCKEMLAATRKFQRALKGVR